MFVIYNLEKRKRNFNTKEGGSEALRRGRRQSNQTSLTDANVPQTEVRDKPKFGIGEEKRRGEARPAAGPPPRSSRESYFALNSTTSWTMFMVGLLEVILAV